LIWKFGEESECELLLHQLISSLPVVKRHGALAQVANSKSSFDYIANLFDCQLREESPVAASVDAGGESPAMPAFPKRIDEGILNFEGSFVAAAAAATAADETLLEERKYSAAAGLNRMLKRLSGEQTSLKAETKVNEELGRQVTIRVMQSAAPNECDKYKLHLEETDKITSLLLGLTARLARTENCLRAAETDSAYEKDNFKSKKEKLVDQLEEAKKLRMNIDKKSVAVGKILQKYLTQDQFADYKTYICNKTRLNIQTRLTNDRMAAANEQLKAVQDI